MSEIAGRILKQVMNCNYNMTRPEYRSRYNESLRAGRSRLGIPVRGDFSDPFTPATKPTQRPVQRLLGLSRGPSTYPLLAPRLRVSSLISTSPIVRDVSRSSRYL